MQVELVGLKRRAGEGGRGVELLGVNPREETLERPVVGVDGTLRVGAGGEVFEEHGGEGREAVGFGWGGGGGAEAALPLA